MSEILEQAKRWVFERGVSVIPIGFMSKKPETPWEAYQKRLPTQQELSSWFASRLHNLGIVMGGWNNLVVVDFDNLDLFLEWYNPDEHNTLMVKTARGVHVYLYTEQKTANKKFPGGDIKSQGGYVLAPPSIHPSGAVYQTLVDSPIIRVDKLADYFPQLQDYGQEEKRSEPVLPDPLKPVQVGGEIVLPDPWECANRAGEERPNLGETLNQRIRVIDFFPDAKGSGRFRSDYCPFHDDHNPSFWIDTERNLCGCHSCGISSKPMDVINLYAKITGLDNRAAMFELQRIYLK